MKRIVLLFLLFVSLSFYAKSQTIDGRYYTYIATNLKWNYGYFSKGLMLPSDTAASSFPGIAIKGGKMYFNPGNSSWKDVAASADSLTFATILRVRKITDSLSSAFNAQLATKQDAGSYSLTGHGHAISDITNLQSSLDAKLAVTTAASTYVPLARTINGVDLSANRTFTTTDISEGSRLYFTDVRARGAISLTNIGSSGAATYNSTSGAFNIPAYTAAGLGAQATLVSGTNIKTINGTSVLGSGDISISSSVAWGGINGTLSNQTDLQTALNGKQAAGSYANSTHSHVIADVTSLQSSLNAKLNISDSATMLSPYLKSASAGSTYVPLSRTINGLDMSANRTLSTSDIGEGSNLYYSDTRSRAAHSLTSTGSSGAATYNSTTGVLNIPTYTLAGLGGEPAITAGTTAQYWRGDKTWQTLPVYTLSGLGGVPTTRTLTINGTPFDLSADRSWTISSGAVAWGSITGTLSAQTDLQTALSSKANAASPALTGTVSVNNGSPAASAAVDISSTTKGVLLPRMTAVQRAAITSPAEGLIVVQIDGVKGLYIYIDSAWHAIVML
jgi:hypothetical protein